LTLKAWDRTKDLTFEAKARTKDLTLKAKDRTKDLTLMVKARTKGSGLRPPPGPRTEILSLRTTKAKATSLVLRLLNITWVSDKDVAWERG